MSAFYFDSSVLVKRFTVETGTKFIIDLMRPSARHRLYSAKITEAEVYAAFSRKRKGLVITPDFAAKSVRRFRRLFQQILIVPI